MRERKVLSGEEIDAMAEKNRRILMTHYSVDGKLPDDLANIADLTRMLLYNHNCAILKEREN